MYLVTICKDLTLHVNLIILIVNPTLLFANFLVAFVHAFAFNSDLSKWQTEAVITMQESKLSPRVILLLYIVLYV